MPPPKPDPTAERIAAALLAVFFLLFGWFTLIQGGISLGGKSGRSVLVDGNAGLGVAVFTFLVAAMGVAMLLKSLRADRKAYWLGAALVLLPPLVFVLLTR
jgi:hypothetical protein